MNEWKLIRSCVLELFRELIIYELHTEKKRIGHDWNPVISPAVGSCHSGRSVELTTSAVLHTVLVVVAGAAAAAAAATAVAAAVVVVAVEVAIHRKLEEVLQTAAAVAAVVAGIAWAVPRTYSDSLSQPFSNPRKSKSNPNNFHTPPRVKRERGKLNRNTHWWLKVRHEYLAICGATAALF